MTSFDARMFTAIDSKIDPDARYHASHQTHSIQKQSFFFQTQKAPHCSIPMAFRQLHHSYSIQFPNRRYNTHTQPPSLKEYTHPLKTWRRIEHCMPLSYTTCRLLLAH